MKYLLSTPILDAQIVEIRRKIMLSMNGIVSEQMTKSGIIYKKNYGVTIPRIKEIAADYSSNHDLAQRLWTLQIRETMIMATLLEQPEKFSATIADDWVAQFNQIEIIEQSCMNLFCKLDFANALCSKWVQSNKLWIQITGFILAARIVGKLNTTETAAIIEKGMELSVIEDFHLYKAIGLCLSRLCRKSKETASRILKEIEALSQSNSISQQYICNEVKQEIIFLDIL
ncbi:MAG TPA: DNA alkylation repair protein [Paludibacter sp.]